MCQINPSEIPMPMYQKWVTRVNSTHSITFEISFIVIFMISAQNYTKKVLRPLWSSEIVNPTVQIMTTNTSTLLTTGPQATILSIQCITYKQTFKQNVLPTSVSTSVVRGDHYEKNKNKNVEINKMQNVIKEICSNKMKWQIQLMRQNPCIINI